MKTVEMHRGVPWWSFTLHDRVTGDHVGGGKVLARGPNSARAHAGLIAGNREVRLVDPEGPSDSVSG